MLLSVKFSQIKGPMLEKELKINIPTNLHRFPKLTKGKDPYHYYSWDIDRDTNKTIIRYWFWDNKRTHKRRKRVFVNEIESLLVNAHHQGINTRKDFRACCPKTKSDGKCGFAVIVRILEFFHIVEPLGKGNYKIINDRKIEELLGIDDNK